MKDPSIVAAIGAGALTVTLPVEHAVYGAAGGAIMVFTMLAAALSAPEPLTVRQWQVMGGRGLLTVLAGSLAAWLLTPALAAALAWGLDALLPGAGRFPDEVVVLVAVALGFLALTISPALAARATAEIEKRKAPQ